jgi:hypothetical protein
MDSELRLIVAVALVAAFVLYEADYWIGIGTRVRAWWTRRQQRASYKRQQRTRLPWTVRLDYLKQIQGK